jgi:NAD-dependent dihydropyrimidine dehydrogenase PreA subunit
MLRYIDDVVTLKYDAAKCTGCGVCAIVCARGVFEMINRRARITDRDLCIECGACALNCAAGAIGVRAGVGCATGVILGSLGVQSECCCSPQASDKQE